MGNSHSAPKRETGLEQRLRELHVKVDAMIAETAKAHALTHAKLDDLNTALNKFKDKLLESA